MFFTKWGASSPMLERTVLDGADRTVLVQQKIVYPYGVTVDYPTQHVYWVDTYLDFVERIDYDGSNRRTIKKGFPVSLKEYYVCCMCLVIISSLKNALMNNVCTHTHAKLQTYPQSQTAVHIYIISCICNQLPIRCCPLHAHVLSTIYCVHLYTIFQFGLW